MTNITVNTLGFSVAANIPQQTALRNAYSAHAVNKGFGKTVNSFSSNFIHLLKFTTHRILHFSFAAVSDILGKCEGVLTFGKRKFPWVSILPQSEYTSPGIKYTTVSPDGLQLVLTRVILYS